MGREYSRAGICERACLHTHTPPLFHRAISLYHAVVPTEHPPSAPPLLQWCLAITWRLPRIRCSATCTSSSPLALLLVIRHAVSPGHAPKWDKTPNSRPARNPRSHLGCCCSAYKDRSPPKSHKSRSSPRCCRPSSACSLISFGRTTLLSFT